MMCSEIFLARSRLLCGRKYYKPTSNNPVTVLRRELKAVFGILLKTIRAGRQRVRRYQLCVPSSLLDLATSSSFYNSKTLPTVQRLTTSYQKIPAIFSMTSSEHKHVDSSKFGKIKGKYSFENKVYNIVDFGGGGNCLFLAVAGSLRAVLPNSLYDHRALRDGVSKWYIRNGQQHQMFLNARPSEVILDNPDILDNNCNRR